MSEYQRYEFLAIDRPLSEDAIDDLRDSSTRATITSTRFFNEYHWGDFKGDPDDMMDRYFDAYIYWANWGSRELQLKVPTSAIDVSAMGDYQVEGGLELRQAGSFTVIRMRVDFEPGDGWFDDEGLLDTLGTLREALMQGDRRALYIGWLACTLSNNVLMENDTLEVPVPPGMATLTPALEALADFLDVWPGLLGVAAERSAPTLQTAPSTDELRAWLGALPDAEKIECLVRLLADDDRAARAALLRRFNQEIHPLPPATAASRTIEELHEAAIQWEKVEDVRLEREAAAARQSALDALAMREPAAWQEAERLILEKHPASYDQAVPVLVDLMALAEREGRKPEFQKRLDALLAGLTRRPALMDRLRRAGLA